MKSSNRHAGTRRPATSHRRPPVSAVLAILALFAAVGGTATAAETNTFSGPHRSSGDRLIRKHSLSGNRLRNGTITRRQMNLKLLGKVPSAATADTAQTAGTAQSAGTARTAADASALGGQPATAFEQALNFVRTGLIKAAPGQTVPLTSFGPFTATLKCTSPDSGMVDAEIDVKSSEPNSYAAYTELTDPGKAYDVWDAYESDTAQETDGSAHFVSPSGKAYAVDLLAAENTLGLSGTCFADVSASPS